MILGLSLAFLALRAGLAMRARRQRGAVRDKGLLARHLALARPAVVLAALGLLSGPASAIWLRDWTPLRTLHGWLALLAAILFIAAGSLGLGLSRRRISSPELHGWLGLLGMLAAALAGFAGFVLLP
jgi:hypothetical protein